MESYNFSKFQPEQFNQFADFLLNRCDLVLLGKTVQLGEIEFYYHSEDHPDRYTHMNPMQLENGRFYLHKFGNGSLKNGTFKGLDICFGDKDRRVYFGVLIRSLNCVSGPCKTVDYIIDNLDCESVHELDKNISGIGIWDSSALIHLKLREDRKDKIYTGPRVGLSDKYPDYRDRKYRYVSESSYKIVKKDKRTLG